mgnify:CR=1 FL=1
MALQPMHPIVAQMSPSPEQQAPVLERGRDVVVTAGAGTGKTRTLVARYLSLLAEGLALRSVVAVTFTQKAAREMRNRVRDEVRRYLERAGLTPTEREQWQEVYTGLDAARIGTIHSLCAEILRAHPAEAGLDPRFDMLEEGRIAILRGRALEEALTWAADDEAAVTLFTLLGEGGLRDALDSLVKQRLDVASALAGLPADALAHWRDAIAARQGRVLDQLLALPEWQDAVSTLAGSAANAPDDPVEIQRLAALAAVGASGEGLDERLAALSRLDGINLSGGRQASWPGGKDELGAVKAALKRLRALWKDRASVLGRRLNALDERMAAALPALRAAFATACERYEALKRERNGLDFDDLEDRALALLREHPGVRERWQREVAALLVDEFQDTNGRQRDLVRILNGAGGKLFIVGDAKQSIYGFRGADVTVFRAERERIPREGGVAFGLAVSYRAHRELVEGLNDLLQPILGDNEVPGRPWIEPFEPLLPHREEAGPGFAPPYVELHLTVGAKGDGALDRSADALAARIVELVEGGCQVVDGDGVRALRYEDVAILCRASNSFGAYEDALERAGAPFLTVAGRGFYDRPEVRDLLNGLRALADPTDGLALAGLLRSPAFGLSDAALYGLCEACRRDGAGSLWDVLRAAGGDLAAEDVARSARAAAVIADVHGRVGRATVADVLKAFLDATDYRAALIQAGQARGARNVAKLLADAHVSGIVGVGEFLEYVGGLRDAGTREGEARATAEGAVQIMSVHAAKGLEFPIVAIGDVTYGGRGVSGVGVDPELGVLLPLKDEAEEQPAIYLVHKGLAGDREAAESDRLLYVAATRARERLILSGCISLKKGGAPGKLGGWLGRIGGPDVLGLSDLTVPYDEAGSSATCLALRVGGTTVHCTVYEPNVAWGPLAAEGRAEPEPVRSPFLAPPSVAPPSVAPTVAPLPLLAPVEPGVETVDEPTSAQDRIPPQRVWRVVPSARRAHAPAWVVGSIVHRALAAWRLPDDGFGHWAEVQARGYGITDVSELRDAANRSRRLLQRFQEHVLYRTMANADRRLHEVPYSLVVDGRIESGIVDALYLAAGVWTIVEFKTDRVRDAAHFQTVLASEDYVIQAERYMSAVRHLLMDGDCAPLRCVLCMLDYGGEVVVHELDT